MSIISAHCSIRAELDEGCNEVDVSFCFRTSKEAECFMAIFHTAVERGTVSIGSVTFPPLNMVEVTD